MEYTSSSSNMISVLVVGAATVLFLAAAVIIKHYGNMHRIPPGPLALPIIGHFHLLTGKNKPIHQILNSLSEIYGPIMHLRFGSRPVLVINSSDLAKECFTVNDKCFASRPQLAQGQHLSYNYSMLGWAPYGAYWRNVRKICALELLSSKRIQLYSPKRMREICKSVNFLFEEAQLQKKRIVNMRNVLSQLTFNILMTMIIDDRYFGMESGISLAEVTHLIEESDMLHGVINIGDYIPSLKWLDLQGYERAMKKAQEKLDLYMQIILDKHRQMKVEAEEEMDFIDVLISQAEENSQVIHDKDAFIKATAMVMFLAGSDTSSVTLEWALSLLLSHPHVMNKVQEEVDSKVGQTRLVEESDIPQLKYLQAIVKETLRLYPPVPLLLPHKSIEACTVGGFPIPAGTLLMVNTWAFQRDPRVWNKPLEFIPERFMEKEIEIDNIHMRGDDFEMIPFGAGRRGCPGASLAMCMVQITLARLLQGFEWFVPDGKVVDMNEGIGLTMPRAQPLEVCIKPRLPHCLYKN